MVENLFHFMNMLPANEANSSFFSAGKKSHEEIAMDSQCCMNFLLLFWLLLKQGTPILFTPNRALTETQAAKVP